MIRFALAACLLAGPALADQTAGPRKIDCYCTDKHGERVEMGGVTCIDVGQTPYMARCEMVLNNPFWRKIQDGCVSSRLRMSPWAQPPTG